PGALDAEAHGAVEGSPAGDLERGVAGAVEDLDEPQQLRGRDRARERLLGEEADRGVDEPGHLPRDLSARTAGSCPGAKGPREGPERRGRGPRAPAPACARARPPAEAR